MTVFGLISLGGQSLLAAHRFIEEISHEDTKAQREKRWIPAPSTSLGTGFAGMTVRCISPKEAQKTQKEQVV